MERIIAIELVVGAQALDLRSAALTEGPDGPSAEPVAPGVGVREAHARIRTRIAHLDRDREPGPDLAAATELVHGGTLADLASPT